MNKALKKVLQLDSLINFLSWQDRTEIHQYAKGGDITSNKIISALIWIASENWQPPEMRYEDDRLLYFYDPDSDLWLTDENYTEIYFEYKEDLQKLKYT